MTTRIWRVGILTTLALLLMGAPGRAAPPDEDAPAAIQVVVRGQKSLEEAMRAAASMAWEGGAARPVAILVDVTPNVQRAGEAIAEALRSLGGDAGAVPSWTIAPLGEKLRTAASDPADLASAVSGVLAETTDVVDTFGALEDSIDAWREEDGVVVYLADWHFEDDVDLEDFIEDLQRKGHTLSVVGSEAAFRRGWNDGFREGTERTVENVRGFGFEDYWEGIGRDPFGRPDADAPWHGGDTAYPYAPYRWHTLLWSTSFSQSDWDLADLDDAVADGLDDLPSDDDLARLARLAEILSELHEIEGELLEAEGEERELLLARQRELEAELDALQASLPEPEPEPTPPAGGRGGLPGGLPLPPEDLDPEDLSGRLPGGGGQDEKAPPWIDPTDLLRRFPLPSAYGPYGLMRAAGVTGGRYVLYSWNPSGRKNVVYEYARCNLFPPDLRSRKEILRNLRGNPWARGMIQAWHTVLDARTEVIAHTPPVKPNLRSAARMDRPEDLLGFLSGMWENPSEQRAFIKHANRSAEAAEEAIGILDEALEDAGEPEDGVAQRYEAEALLLRHTLRAIAFELRELVAAAETVTREDWREQGELGVSGRTWIPTGRDPARIRTREEPYDPEAGQVVLEERKALLARLRGTPLGEELALNDVETARPTTWERVEQVPGTGRSPSESVDPGRPTPRPPGGGSGGGGPATGR